MRKIIFFLFMIIVSCLILNMLKILQFIILLFLTYLISNILKHFYFRYAKNVRKYFFKKKRLESFQRNIYNTEKLNFEFEKNNVNVKKDLFLPKYFGYSKVAVLNKNFFSNKKINLLNKFIFLNILSKKLDNKTQKFSLLNFFSKTDISSINFNQSFLKFLNTDSYLLKKRQRNYYSLLLIHFLILKLQRQELIDSLNLNKKIGNYPFALAYDEEVISFRRSKYFDYTSTELFFLLLYGLLEWLLIFYLIHLGFCIFYDFNIFENFFKIFENFLPNHFHAYSEYLRISLLLNSIFFFFLLIYTLTDWVFELTDEVSTYQLPPKDWFVDVFLPTLQGILIIIFFSLIFFLFIYNGYVILIVLLSAPFEYIYNFIFGSYLSLKNLIILITIFDLNIFLKLFFFREPGILSEFYAPFFNNPNIFYKNIYSKNFLLNYPVNVFFQSNLYDSKINYHFNCSSIDYQNFLELKIWKNELLFDLRKYNYFLQQEDEIFILNNFINRGFRGLGLRLDNQYFFDSIDFINKGKIRHFRPNNESLIDNILSTKYQKSYSNNNKDIKFFNLSFFPNESQLSDYHIFDFSLNEEDFASNVVSNNNNFYNYNINFLKLNDLILFPLDMHDFVNYKLNSKFIYNDLNFENLEYFSILKENKNAKSLNKTLNNFIKNGDFLPFVLPEHQKELLLLNLKIFNLDLDFCVTIDELKNYIKTTLLIGDYIHSNSSFLENKKFKNNLVINDNKYSQKFYYFLKNLLIDDRNLSALILTNIEFLSIKQQLLDNNLYNDEIVYLVKLLKSLENKENNVNLNFSKIIIKNDFLYPFFNIFFKPFYYTRTIDLFSFMSRSSSTNNSLYYNDENNLNYWWNNYLITNNRLFRIYSNFPSILSFSTRNNIIYLKNFGEKLKFKNNTNKPSFNFVNENIKEIFNENFSSYYNLEVKIQNFSYFQNNLWNRYFHKFFDSTFITDKREVFLIEYNDNFKNKLSFIPKFEKNTKRFSQTIFSLNWKMHKDLWLEYPQQSYISPFLQYSLHLINSIDYYKLELDFSQVILDYESFNLFDGYRTPLFFSENKQQKRRIEINSNKNSSGFVIDRNLLRNYYYGDFVGLSLLKDYQFAILFDRQNFMLNNFFNNLFLDKLFSLLFYDLNLKNFNFVNFGVKKNSYSFFEFEKIKNFKDFYKNTIQFNLIDTELHNNFMFSNSYLIFSSLDFKKALKNDLKLFIPNVNTKNIFVFKYMVNYFNLYPKQEELCGVFERINIKLSDFIIRFFLKKNNVDNFNFFNNYLFFFNLRNYLKIKSVDPWNLYLINKNFNIYDSLLCNDEFLFAVLPYDELIQNSKKKLLNLQKLTYILTPYRVNYKGFRNFGILRKDFSNRSFKEIISFYLDKKNFYNFKLKLINEKLQKKLFNYNFENYKNKMQRDLVQELSFEIGITPRISRKLKYLSMDYRILHFTQSRHILLKSKLFCNVFYDNKINPYLLTMYNFPFNNEFSAIWSKSFHTILLLNGFFEKIKVDKIFGKEVINNQFRYKRLFFLKFFQTLNLNHLEGEDDIFYLKNFQKNFSLVFDTKSFLFLKNKKKIINFKNFSSTYNDLFSLIYDHDLQFYKIEKSYKYDFFYNDLSVPLYDFFVNDQWVSKRFRKYGFQVFKTYRTFYYKDDRFPIQNFLRRRRIKNFQNFQILEKPQLKKKKFTKKKFVYHDQKLLIYKFLPALRPKVPKKYPSSKYRWLFITNKIKPTPVVLILKNNEIRSNKIKCYILFLKSLGNIINLKNSSSFWIYFFNNNFNKIYTSQDSFKYLLNNSQSILHSDYGKFLFFKNNSKKLFFFSNTNVFKFFLHLDYFNKYFVCNNFFFLSNNFKNFNYNYDKLFDNDELLREKKLNQFKYLTRFLILKNKKYNYLNFYSPIEYFFYKKLKWNNWLLLNRYRKIEEHYIQYNFSKDKTFSSSMNDGNDFNLKEIEEVQRMERPYFLSSPSVTISTLKESDELPFTLMNQKKYYIPYIHENWYYNNLKASYPINEKNLKFFSFYYDVYKEIRNQTLIVLKKKIEFNFFQIQKIFYKNNLLYKYNFYIDTKITKNENENLFLKKNLKMDFFFFISLKSFIEYQYSYFNILIFYKPLIYDLFTFLKQIPLLGEFLIIIFKFFFSIYIFIFIFLFSYVDNYFSNWLEILYSDFFKFYVSIVKLYFHPFWLFILYFFWILYYYILVRVYTNSREPYDFKNLVAQFDWDEEVYDFDLIRRKYDTKSFFKFMEPTHALFTKNAIEFQEHDKSPTMKEIEKINTFSQEQEIFRKFFFFKSRVKNYWFVKRFPDYDNVRTDFFEMNLTRQNNNFIYNYFVKPIPKLFLNTNYVSKTNFIFNNNNFEKLILKSYTDSLKKDFSRHGSHTSEFGRFRWLYISSLLFFQFLIIIFVSSFIFFLLF
jgi:hypothetical protein